MAADGSIVIETKIDNKEAQRELNSLAKKIDALQEKLNRKQGKQSALAEEARQIGIEFDNARKKLAEMQSGDKFYANSSIQEQANTVKMLEQEWNKTRMAADKLNMELYDGTQELNRMKEKAGELQKTLAATGSSSGVMQKAMDRMEKSANKFSMRLREVVRSALVFTVISQGLASLREWMGKVIKTNSEAVDAIARLKGALLTMAQPIISVVIPAFTAFLNVLTKIISAIANVISMIFGTTINESADAAESLYEEANALESVGAAASEAASSLAGFDEINQLNSTSASGVGGAGSVIDQIKPAFDDFDTSAYKKKIDEITAYVSGALLALGAILAFSGANIPLGVALMAAGAVGLASLIALNWNSMDEALRTAISRVLLTLGTAALVIGAILCFSGANIPLGIGLMIAGAAMLGTAVALNWSAMDESIKSALTSILTIIGGFAFVIGAILALSGANLPLGIGIMAAGATMLGVAIGLNWSEIPDKVREVVTTILVILGGALLAIGAVLAFAGPKTLALGIGLMAAGAVALGTAVGLNWHLITENVRTVVTTILEILGAALLVIGFVLAAAGVSLPLGIALIAAGAASLVASAALRWNFVEGQISSFVTNVLLIASTAALALGLILIATGVGIPLGIALIAAGAVGLVTAATINWDWILDKLKEMWTNIKNWWNTSVSKYFSGEFWSGLGKNIINGLLNGLKSLWSNITGWVSNAVSWISNAFSGATSSVKSSTFGNSSGGGRSSRMVVPSVSTYSIPRLAKGSVIPSNREFLAVLGDNKQETEVVSPLSTMKQAMMEALQEAGGFGNGTIEVKLILDGKQIARNQIKHINQMTQQAGKPVLLI